jgi:FkbM family methyltransferase
MKFIRDLLEAITRKNIYIYTLLRYVSGRWLYRFAHEPDFSAFKIIKSIIKPGSIFLDVGANDGISVLSFNLYDAETPVVSIEPNVHHRTALDRIRKKKTNFNYHLLGASSTKSKLKLYTPVYKGFALTSFAAMDPQVIKQNLPVGLSIKSIADKVTFSEHEVDVIPLDQLDLSPGIIKIDVEGFEHEVVSGLKSTIQKHQPIFLIEYNPNSYVKIKEQVTPLGYEAYVYKPGSKTFTIYTGQETCNLFLLPQLAVKELSNKQPSLIKSN